LTAKNCPSFNPLVLAAFMVMATPLEKVMANAKDEIPFMMLL